MKHIARPVLALAALALAASIAFFPIGTAMAQSCETQAVSAAGKPLHGAAKNSFVKKCKKDACESKAVSAALVWQNEPTVVEGCARRGEE